MAMVLPHGSQNNDVLWIPSVMTCQTFAAHSHT